MNGVTLKIRLRHDPEDGGCWFALPFDPREKFGKVRAPVVVTINGYAFRTTVAAMGGEYCVIVNKANRQGAGIGPEDRVTVTVAPDMKPRTVTVPPDLKKALAADKRLQAVWEKLSYTHRREYVSSLEEAKRPETRVRRLQRTLEQLAEKA